MAADVSYSYDQLKTQHENTMHNSTSYNATTYELIKKGYCHNHEDNNVVASILILVVLILGSMVANAGVLYILYHYVSDKFVRHYSLVLLSLDLCKVFLILFPALMRLCGSGNALGPFCYTGYWINLFATQSSILVLILAAYDRVMVLMKNENYGYSKPRWKRSLFFGVIIPGCYVLFDVMYTRMYVAKRDNSYHELMCYDQKLGWCVTKGAPHVHEIDIAGKPTGDGVLVAPHITELTGSSKAGVFICQAHIMNVLLLVALLGLQSGHANYKKLFEDTSIEGSYYVMLLAVNVWTYFPTATAHLVDTFTASIFPKEYYENFYIYMYMAQFLLCMLNVVPLIAAYREYILPTALTETTSKPPAKSKEYKKVSTALPQPDKTEEKATKVLTGEEEQARKDKKNYFDITPKACEISISLAMLQQICEEEMAGCTDGDEYSLSDVEEGVVIDNSVELYELDNLHEGVQSLYEGGEATGLGYIDDRKPSLMSSFDSSDTLPSYAHSNQNTFTGMV